MRDRRSSPRTRSTCCWCCRAAGDDRAAPSGRGGLFVLAGEPGAPFEVTGMGVRGRGRRVRGARRAVRPEFRRGDVHVLRAEAVLLRRGRRVGSRPRVSSCRAGGDVRSSGSGRSCPAKPTARSTPAANRACCSRAATAARRSSSTPRSSSTRRGRTGSRARAAALPALDRALARGPRPARRGDLGRRRLADRRRRRRWCARRHRPVALDLPEDAPADQIALCVHRLERAPSSRGRVFMPFHGGVFSTDR